jgi:hypothetical protein
LMRAVLARGSEALAAGVFERICEASSGCMGFSSVESMHAGSGGWGRK